MPRMRDDEQEVLDILEENLADDEIVGVQYDVIDEFALESKPPTRLLVRGVLQLMSRSPEADWGIPGPMVNLLEKSEHHLEELVRVCRAGNVTATLVLQLQRYANVGRAEALELLERAAADDDD